MFCFHEKNPLVFNSAVIFFCVMLEQTAKILFAEFLTFTYNTGAAFSIFSNSPEFILICSGISCAVLIFLCLFVKMNFYARLGLLIMSGGALSNFLERFFYGYVTDWIPSPFPFIEINFNLADVEISLGALTAFIALNFFRGTSQER